MEGGVKLWLLADMADNMNVMNNLKMLLHNK